MPVTDLATQLEQLRRLVALADGRSDVSVAQNALNQADERISLTTGRTVIALAGATGSGKSSLFNALTGTQLATPGALRPTTETALGVSFSTEATSLLDWLEVPRRHLISGADPALNDLVLLDLPDHDSTERAHRIEVERLVRVVDQLVWVVDPQKYADAALHDDFLRPMAAHRNVLQVALNQVDLLDLPELEQCFADLRKILDDEGLSGVPIFPVSARTGAGVSDLRRSIIQVVTEKDAALRRLQADVTVAAQVLEVELGDPVEPASASGDAALEASLADAAGVDIVVDAVVSATRQRGASVTGWPLLTLWRRRRPDALRRLRLGTGGAGRPAELPPSALPRRSVSSAARIDSAIRLAGQVAGERLPAGWRDSVLSAARTNQDRLSNTLDQAVVATDLGDSTQPGWWRLLGRLQSALFVIFLIGLLWLIAGVFLPPLAQAGQFGGWSAPLILVLAGAVGGAVTSVIGQSLTNRAAIAAGERARKRLLASVDQVTKREILAPINEELARHRDASELARALLPPAS